jgi:acyl-coenzyme A thioesterase PaaI-like protein
VRFSYILEFLLISLITFVLWTYPPIGRYLNYPSSGKNKNHLGGAHACAIATLGEFTAGLLLTRALGSSTYRIIMTDLYVDYLKQGRTHLYGTALITDQEINIITPNARKMGWSLIKCKLKLKMRNKRRLQW